MQNFQSCLCVVLDILEVHGLTALPEKYKENILGLPIRMKTEKIIKL